jgi:hypothetical protein
MAAPSACAAAREPALSQPGRRAELVRGSSAISASTHAVASHYFEVRGRLRLDGAVVEERSLVFKQRGDVRTCGASAAA